MKMDEMLDAVADFLRRHSIQRFWRGMKYSLLFMSGIFAAIAPSRLVTEEVGTTVAVAWAFCMSLSSLICIYTPITDKWIGELGGIPLLAAVIALYGFSAILDASFNQPETLILMAYGLVVLAFACSLVARWLDVLAISRVPGEEVETKGA